MRYLTLTDQHSVADGRLRRPPTREPETLGELLETVAPLLEDGGVLALAGTWTRYVPDVVINGVTGTTWELTENAPHGGSWRARVQAGDVWMRWTRAGDDRAVWVADLEGMEPGSRTTPLVGADPLTTSLQWHQWSTLTGRPWIGSPGMTGNDLLMRAWHRGAAPRWQDRDYSRITGPCERAYSPLTWHSGHDGPVIGYDANKAYLAAYQGAELAADGLEHTVRPEFSPALGGFWRVEIEPWADKRLPDPAGYGHVLEDGTRWLTTPTLALVDDLAQRGLHGGYSVLEAYTAPARRITRTWAERLRDIIADTSGTDVDYLARAAGRVYKATWGMWARTGGLIQRQDWHYTILATARATLWRKLERYGREEDRWPVRIETDAVFYPSDGRPWPDQAPAAMTLDPTGRKLGAWKPVEPK